jgi:hypothetical protein
MRTNQKERRGKDQVGMGAAAPVKSSNVSAGAQVQKRFMSPYARFSLVMFTTSQNIRFKLTIIESSDCGPELLLLEP